MAGDALASRRMEPGVVSGAPIFLGVGAAVGQGRSPCRSSLAIGNHRYFDSRPDLPWLRSGSSMLASRWMVS